MKNMTRLLPYKAIFSLMLVIIFFPVIVFAESVTGETLSLNSSGDVSAVDEINAMEEVSAGDEVSTVGSDINADDTSASESDISAAGVDYIAAGTEWRQTGSGTQYYAEFPSGYYTGSSLYNQYNGKRIDAYENATSKRTVNTQQVSYIYWHWTFNNQALPNNNYNVFIEANKGVVNGRSFIYFTDFESAENYSEYDPAGHHDTVPGLCFYHWRNIPSDGSWWWFRTPIYQQTYTDYKLVTTEENISEAVVASKTDAGSLTITDNGKTIEENLVVKAGSQTLTLGTDYTLSYDKTITAGPVKVTITGKGTYSGSTTVTCTLVPKKTVVRTVTVENDRIVVYWDEEVNIDGYEIQYSLNANFSNSLTLTCKKGSKTTDISGLKQNGTYYVRIRTYRASGGKRYCSGWSVSQKIYVSIKNNTVDLSKAAVKPIPNKSYTSKAIKPVPTIVNGTYVLKKGSDYSVKYTNNVKVGIATVTMTGKGIYYGTVKTTFRIIPRNISIRKSSCGKKKITVKWKKQKKFYSGCQIRYASKSDFSNAKIKRVKGKKNKVSLSGLNPGTIYYIEIRSFCVRGKKTYYSSWSKCKSVKTKGYDYSGFSTPNEVVYSEGIKIGNYMYAVMGNEIKRVNLKKKGSKAVTTLCKAKQFFLIADLFVAKGYLYFVPWDSFEPDKYESSLYRIKLSGGKKQRVAPDRFFVLYNNKLVCEYSDHGYLFRETRELDGSNSKTICLGYGQKSNIKRIPKTTNAKGYKVVSSIKGLEYPMVKDWLKTPKGRKYYLGMRSGNY